MAKQQDIKLLAKLIKELSSNPNTDTLETVLGNVLGNITSAVISIDGDPTLEQLSINTYGVFRNKLTGVTAMWINDNGTIKSFLGIN